MPRYSVLASADGVRVLVQESVHEDAAIACGFTELIWSEDAVSYRAAIEAWKAVGVDPLNVNVAGELNPHDEGLDLLDADELDVVASVVRALVDRDETFLRSVGAYRHGSDPYLWTAPYGRWDRVDLMVPPGTPETWRGHVLRGDSRSGWTAVDVDVWTTQEGPSDLSLELDLQATENGPVATFVSLHVL